MPFELHLAYVNQRNRTVEFERKTPHSYNQLLKYFTSDDNFHFLHSFAFVFFCKFHSIKKIHPNKVKKNATIVSDELEECSSNVFEHSLTIRLCLFHWNYNIMARNHFFFRTHLSRTISNTSDMDQFFKKKKTLGILMTNSSSER